MKRRLKINGVIIFSAVILMAVFPEAFFRESPTSSFYAVDLIAQVFGIAFILLGLTLRVSSRGYKSEHSQSGHNLVQTGPYAMVRNPMYLGILLIGFGIVLTLFRWWLVCLFLVIFVLRYILLIFKEEKKLCVAFPHVYKAYCKEVPRLLPSMKTFFQAPVHKYLPLKFSWINKEIGSIFGILIATLVLNYWVNMQARGIEVCFWETLALFCVIIVFVGLAIYLNKRTTLKR